MIKIAIAQVNVLVGAVEKNTDLIIEYCISAHKNQHCDLIVFPELALTGYPPEDLLLRPELKSRVASALKKIQSEVNFMNIILGTPCYRNNKIYNSAAWISDGKIQTFADKLFLPNYSVFDEKRYFSAGSQPTQININGIAIGILICEDIWYAQPVTDLVSQGVKLIININASPFHIDKIEKRQQLVREHVKNNNISILYVNLVGGQDELVFDGGSFIVASNNSVNFCSPEFEQGLSYCEISNNQNNLDIVIEQNYPRYDTIAAVYQALVLGVRDYILKNGFSTVILGLSGGIDSALTLAILVDAIGAKSVEAVMMPFKYTAQMSCDDAEQQAKSLGVKYKVIAINKAYQAFIEMLTDEFVGTEVDITEQNLQARCRGILLMAIANKKRKLVINTGNKSEMAVGYATLYGDMVGGFAALKDVPKTMVYQLAKYRNSISEVNIIPTRVITRPPSAELAADQQDNDSLPEYEILDKIIELYVEHDLDLDAIIATGIEPELAQGIIKQIEFNEYKRRQAAPGVKISRRSFSRDRRYPITSGF